MEDRQNPAPGRRHRHLRRVGWIAAVGAALFGLGRWGSPRAVEWAVARWAQERGLGELSFRVRRIGWRSAELSELRIANGGDLAIRRARIDYVPWRLLAGRVDAVRLEGLAIAGSLDASGPSFGALDSLWRPPTPGPTRPAAPGADPDAAARARPVPPRLHLEGARLDLSTPFGPVSARFDARLEAGDLRADLKLEAALRKLRIPPLFAAAVDVQLEGVLAASPAVQTLDLQDCATLALRGLRLRGWTAPDSPLEVCVRADGSDEPILRREPDGTIAWRARVLPAAPGATRGMAFAVSGRHRTQRGDGEAEIVLEPLRFAAGGLQPAVLVPPLARWIDSASGELSARARLQWSPENTEVRLRLDLDELDLQARALSVEGLTGTLLARYPLRDPAPGEPPAPIHFRRARVGQLELTRGSAALSLTAEAGLRVHRIAWQMFGGHVSGTGAVRAGGANQRWDLFVEDLEIAEVFAYLDVDGLDGHGRLRGRLPLEIRDGQLRIRGGALHSQQGGRVRYHPGKIAPSDRAADSGGGTAGESLDRRELVIGILEDFRYESAEIHIDAETGDNVTLKAHLQSSGGEASGGRPVEFNLTLELPLTEILRGVAAASAVPREIEQRVRASELE